MMTTITMVSSITGSNHLNGLSNPQIPKRPKNVNDPCRHLSRPRVFSFDDKAAQILVHNLGQLSRVTNVGPHRNNFTVKFQSFRGLSELELACSGHDSFSAISSYFFQGYGKLLNMSCVGCNITGQMPEFIGSLKSLTAPLNLSNSRLSCEISANLTTLQNLQLNGDQIVCLVPEILANMKLRIVAHGHGSSRADSPQSTPPVSNKGHKVRLIILGVLGNITSFVFLSVLAWLTAARLQENLHVDPFPLFLIQGNFIIWAAYGLTMKMDWNLLLIANGLGIPVHASHVLVLYLCRFQSTGNMMLRWFVYGIVVVLSVLFLCLSRVFAWRSNLVGSVGLGYTGGMVMYRFIKLIWDDVHVPVPAHVVPNNLLKISLSSSACAIINTTVWIAYGVMKDQKFIWIPNTIVLVFSSVQVVMILSKMKNGQEGNIGAAVDAGQGDGQEGNNGAAVDAGQGDLG